MQLIYILTLGLLKQNTVKYIHNIKYVFPEAIILTWWLCNTTFCFSLSHKSFIYLFCVIARINTTPHYFRYCNSQYRKKRNASQVSDIQQVLLQSMWRRPQLLSNARCSSSNLGTELTSLSSLQRLMRLSCCSSQHVINIKCLSKYTNISGASSRLCHQLLPRNRQTNHNAVYLLTYLLTYLNNDVDDVDTVVSYCEHGCVQNVVIDCT